MDQFKCEKCGKAFKNNLALSIHVGRTHGSKAAKAKRAAARAGVTCRICGRSFALPMHLARHVQASHGKAKAVRRVVRRRARRVAALPVQAPSLNVAALSVDELLALKGALDARLNDIAGRMRAARVLE